MLQANTSGGRRPVGGLMFASGLPNANYNYGVNGVFWLKALHSWLLWILSISSSHLPAA